MSRTVICVLAVTSVFLVWSQQADRLQVESHVTIISVDGKSKELVASLPERFEAPNWSRDGNLLILNSGGQLWKIPVTGGELELIPTGAVKSVNNDHGISPDGKRIVISAGQMYVLPFAGGEPHQVTQKSPSYFHGWSPDGRTLAYCANRNGNYDIYGIPVDGGDEARLTTSPAYDDGPDYSPDGKWIYFNSDRSGSWDIWRMPGDGAGPDDARAERVTSDEFEDWFPHPSPDGKWLVFLSYEKGTKGHPPNQYVTLRIMPLPGGALKPPEIKTLTMLFGGQGTLNVNSWAPDSKRFAYVSYSLVK